MNQTVVHVGPTEYTHVNESETPLEFRAELDTDERYTVEVMVQTAGVVREKRKDIGMHQLYY